MKSSPLLGHLFEHIGNNLYRIRKERNLKQCNVASALQITESVVSQVERGRYTSLSLKLLDQFAQYYGVRIDEIIMRAHEL